MYCRKCHYDLHALPPDARRCPECGHAFDPRAPATYLHTPPTPPRWWERVLQLVLLTAVATVIGFAAMLHYTALGHH